MTPQEIGTHLANAIQPSSLYQGVAQLGRGIANSPSQLLAIPLGAAIGGISNPVIEGGLDSLLGAQVLAGKHSADRLLRERILRGMITGATVGGIRTIAGAYPRGK